MLLPGCGSDINEPEDVTPPGMANTIPSDGDVNVSTTVAPKVGFNEAIKYLGNGFFLVNGGQNVQGTSRLTEGRTNELCFIPNQPLDEGQVYTIRLDGAIISDLANNEAEYWRYSSARNFVLNDHSVIRLASL